MGNNNVLLAKKMVKDLTVKLEKSLYELRYSDSQYTVLTESLYSQIKIMCENSACNEHGLSFPLTRVDGEIYLNANNEDLFKVLHVLANEYNIILDYKKVVK